MTKTPAHLGGHQDMCWIDYGALRALKQMLGINTMVDIGSGTGEQVKIARALGIDAVGIDGDGTYKPDHCVDFTTRPFHIGRDFDLAWSVEFLEHVPPQFIRNYMQVFKRAKYIACTASPFSSGRHFNVQHVGYWITRFEQEGFRYAPRVLQTILQNSTMRDCGNRVNFWAISGMAFVRHDVSPPFMTHTSKPWEG